MKISCMANYRCQEHRRTESTYTMTDLRWRSTSAIVAATTTRLILLRCLRANIPAVFSPKSNGEAAPANSNAFTISSYTRIGRVLHPQGANRDYGVATRGWTAFRRLKGGFRSFN